MAHFASRVCFYLEVKEMMQYIITSACPSFPEHLCSEHMSAETSGFILLLSGLLCAVAPLKHGAFIFTISAK